MPTPLDDAPSPFRQFLREMLLAIEAETDLDTALRLAKWLALYLWENPLGVYRLDAIEEAIASKCQPVKLASGTEPQVHAELHVASSVYKNGGHTSLMRCLMRNASCPTHVLITRCENIEADASILSVSHASISSADTSETAQNRITHLVNVMANFKRIVLHIHPDDVECAVALIQLKQIKPDTEIVFVNHADHVFSVGWSTVDHCLEISSYGWALRHKRRVQDRCSFIGIPIPCPPPLEKRGFADTPFVMSGGASFKFKPSHGMSLPDALIQLLRRSPFLHVRIVGASSKDWWWWPLKLRFSNRVHLLKSLAKSDYKDMLSECSIYIDSYPWLGGTAFPEALMLGVPVAGMNGLAWGYSSADEVRSSSVEEFIDNCLRLLAKDPVLMHSQQQARERCIEFHSDIAVRQRMDTYLEKHIPVEPNLSLPNAPDNTRQLQENKRRSVLPSRRRGGLAVTDMKTVAQIHQRSFGMMDWSSLTLLYYAATKSVKNQRA